MSPGSAAVVEWEYHRCIFVRNLNDCWQRTIRRTYSSVQQRVSTEYSGVKVQTRLKFSNFGALESRDIFVALFFRAGLGAAKTWPYSESTTTAHILQSVNIGLNELLRLFNILWIPARVHGNGTVVVDGSGPGHSVVLMFEFKLRRFDFALKEQMAKTFFSPSVLECSCNQAKKQFRLGVATAPQIS